MSESANTRQVGGNHYKTQQGPQHWDYAILVLGNRYLEGNITKYVARHRKKNGLQDLKKALHYLSKLRENFGLLVPQVHDSQYDIIRTNEFCQSAELNYRETRVMHMMASWSTAWDLDAIEQEVTNLYVEQELADSSLEAIKAGAAPGPGYVKQDSEN